MKDASRIMYTIGKVFSVIEIVISSIMLLAGILCRVFSVEIYNEQKGRSFTLDDVKALSTSLIVIASISLIIVFIVLILANNAQKKLKNNKKDIAPHIIMIVIGVFGDIFYLLGGVFGIVAENEDNNTIE
ncbi:MAG: hypothetical protein IKP77_01415 [Acholeplasmatales bacterium]|nr:hypothetical protein [Acholeplasmatales bacterium]